MTANSHEPNVTNPRPSQPLRVFPAVLLRARSTLFGRPAIARSVGMSSIAILGSARSEGNTAAVLQRLITGSCCEVVDLRFCSVAPYNYEGDYPEGDQFLSIIQQIVGAPLTIIATPVYWYSYSAAMKVFIDRFSDLLTAHRELGRLLRAKRFALVSSSAEPWPDKTLVEAFSRFCDYLGVTFVGCAHAQDSGEFVDQKLVASIRSYLAES